ncbi:hypothetical protein chiPu_0020332 [Chiloscyllium punctatum]|uniref:Uncharacterized protein n=1 Tax=Chiloscyllium punctatum TaxID=137246 RepID=A0A401REG7_CHIPU|nr:hypothetical protein [Chiloscyllium punctatum]
MADRDPLSYFAGYGSSGSESESEPEPGPTAVGVRAGGAPAPAPAQAQAQAPASQAALPRPDELFSSVSRPSFLGRPRSGLINWDQRVVRAPEEMKMMGMTCLQRNARLKHFSRRRNVSEIKDKPTGRKVLLKRKSAFSGRSFP